MNYKYKKVALTGVDGFIGGHLLKAFTKIGNVEVKLLAGDIRDPATFADLDYSFDYLFHFAAPSSQVQFSTDPAYCIETTIKGLINAADVCKRNGIRLVYPSTGLLSQEKYNTYAMCKKLGEDYVAGLNMDAIGLRIFATYGPGEGHKRDFASVPYLFARDMVKGQQPLIFGDGKQTRDFIHISDTVSAILHLAEECPAAIVDVGSGVQCSFNRIIKLINESLFDDPKDFIKPKKVVPPFNYVQETAADPSLLNEYCRPNVSFEAGIDDLVKHLKAQDG